MCVTHFIFISQLSYKIIIICHHHHHIVSQGLRFFFSFLYTIDTNQTQRGRTLCLCKIDFFCLSPSFYFFVSLSFILSHSYCMLSTNEHTHKYPIKKKRKNWFDLTREYASVWLPMAVVGFQHI